MNKNKIFQLLIISYFICSPTFNIYPQNHNFKISFADKLNLETITGRVFIILSTENNVEPRLQNSGTQIFGLDVEQLSLDSTVILDETILGFPLKSLKEVPDGDYYVQTLFNVYTKFERSDGHTIWAHMDQWEGQKFKKSPGNIYSGVKRVSFTKGENVTTKLVLSKIIPPIELPDDTKWIKRIKIKSEMLSKFWGHPIYFGATVLLPKGYDENSEVYYPVHYIQSHFGLEPPYNFTTHLTENSTKKQIAGHEFYKEWIAENLPRMICVLFQHPTPYYDDSYAVNSANNGPFGDAIVNELIPEIEKNYRIIKQPYARILSGGSTGGWEALALQVYYPDIFGGSWIFYPDPVDFRNYGLLNLYEDENAFISESTNWKSVERVMKRYDDGQPRITFREVSQYESVLGSKRRGGGQLAIWEAVFGPVGEDGYPKPLWNEVTGEIDKSVVNYMKENHYDLRYYLENNWRTLGPKLVGKLHFSCGDMDGWYLNLATYRMEKFLESTTSPYYDGSFEYGRPLMGHWWRPMTDIGLIKIIGKYVEKNAPKLPSKN